MANGKKHKQAGFKAHVAALKRAAIAVDPDAYLKERPTWRFSLLELVNPYGWHQLTLPAAEQLKSRLASLESMTWQEILYPAAGGRHGHYQNHSIAVADITCKDALARLDEIAPDIDTLMSLHIGNMQRVWGIMSGPVCQLVFWDPNHLIYETKKR